MLLKKINGQKVCVKRTAGFPKNSEDLKQNQCPYLKIPHLLLKMIICLFQLTQAEINYHQ